MSDLNPNIYKNLLQLSIKGDAEAQNMLGAALITGEYVEKDASAGFYWYCQAIKKGHVHAKWNAGSMLVDGDDGTEKNLDLGMMLIEDAAQANQNSACLFIAQCYITGRYGKPINNELAIYWKKKARDYENFKEYDDKPIDLEKDYKLKLKKSVDVKPEENRRE